MLEEEEDILSYEQTDVQFVQEDGMQLGKLRITEKNDIPLVEWIPDLDDTSDDWAVISTPTKVSYNNTESDSITIKNDKKPQCKSFNILMLTSCNISENGRELQLIKRDMVVATFKFHSESANYFLEVLSRYVAVKQQAHSPTEYTLLDKHQSSLDDQLSALNLVPENSRKKTNRPHRDHLNITNLVDAPRKVLGFLHDMRKDPYTTTLTTLSKVYDTVLHGVPEAYASDKGEEDVADLLRSISGMADIEPGYEILIKTEPLAERPEVNRLGSLQPDEFKTYVDVTGSITQVDELKKRIFKGGIHPNLRPELWCYLLNHYEWGDSFTERQERIKLQEQKYFTMKQQWKTMSEEQENNFCAFKERRSLIEKDVNRTDRTHPFYEGEDNPNLENLHDILMTYIMHNFDLGYVQGMSDLLAPILYVVQHEATAFWCFVGFMNRVYRNFDLDQSGMKKQLLDLTAVLRTVDPVFFSFLECRDSSNMYFCFRWLLVRFKREFNYTDTLRLWEILWTGVPCENFHLCLASAILETERDELINNKFTFPDILKHINSLNYRIDLEMMLKKAEAIYLQLAASECVSNHIREILELPPKKPLPKRPLASGLYNEAAQFIPGHVERVSPDNKPDEEEKKFEESLNQSFI